VNDIRRITWSSEGMSRGRFNYDMDPSAAELIAGTAFKMDMISPAGYRIASRQDFVSALDTIDSRYADAIREQKAELYLKDDCLPLYLAYPGLFTVIDSSANPERREITAGKSPDLFQAVLEMLDSEKEDKSIIFNQFPVDNNQFEEDVAILSNGIISEYGLKEWKIVVLTNEFHEHLGIYSIIGAKMGLRAREYYNIGIDELTIVSLAGSDPPVSCMNDGLQVSTGATLGHGTIEVRDDDPCPSARFTFKNSTIEIRLREDLQKEISEDVKDGVHSFGLDSTEYWDFIRRLALHYWARLDRNEIFEITNVP
jgi:pyrimidine-specific ribonucleoside hydrolase